MRCLPYCAIRFTCTSLNLCISVNLKPVPLTSYGGIFERGSREYTLDDFYALALDKMDRYVCLKKSDIIIPEGDDESSSSEEDDDGGDSSDDDEDEDEDEDDKEMLLGNEEAPEIKDAGGEIAEEPVGSMQEMRYVAFSPLTNFIGETEGFSA